MPKRLAHQALALRLSVLGTPTLAADGGPAALFTARRALRPLAFLLLHRRGPVLRESAALALWPDENKEAANANLRRHLYLLGQALPPHRPGIPWIAAGNDRLQLNPDAAIGVDADEFEAAVAAGSLEAAIEAYGGDFFESLYDDWVLLERERLASLYLACLGDLVLQARRRRDFAKATHWAQQLLGADPLREDILRQLMTVRYEAGDSAGAIFEYDDFARRLRAELAVDPMQESQALREAILRGAALDSADAGDRDVMAADARSESAALPFVGRRAELDVLVERWNASARGRGGLVAVAGEAGIGKTRLVREIAAHGAANGGRVLYGTTSYPELQPYQSIAEAVRSALPLVAALEVAPLSLATLAQIVPQLTAQRSGLPEVASANTDDRQQRLFEAMAAVFTALAKPRPLIVILEDLHWAGSGTLAALHFLAQHLAGANVLIVATYREEEVGRLHALRNVCRALRAQHLLTDVAPGPLTRADVTEIVAHVPDIRPYEEQLVPALLERSEGNPLFLNEIIRDLIESPLEGTLLLTRARASGSAPPGIASMVATRVARLSAAAKSLAEIASVAGSGFEIELIREVTGWTQAQGAEAIDELLRYRLVRELPGHHGLQFAFSHQLVADAIYRGIDDAGRVARHRRIAGVVADLYRDRAEEFSLDLARHYELGGDPPAAARYYFMAAQRAMKMYAADEAIDAIGRAYALTIDDRHRRDMLLLRELAYSRRGERAKQRADLDELERIARVGADDELAWEVERRRCTLARAVGDVDVEKACIEGLTLRADAAQNLRWQAEARKLAANLLMTAYDFERCQDASAAALELYRRVGDASGEIESLCLLARNEAQGGSWEKARAFAEEANVRATSVPNAAVVARATLALAHAALSRHNFVAYRELAIKALGTFQTIGDVESEAAALNGIGNACTHMGELALAREHLSRASELFQTIGARRGVAVAQINLGVIEWKLGNLPAAYDAMSTARGEAAQLDFAIAQLTASINLSAIARDLNRFDEALELAQSTAELARRSKLPLYEALALVQVGAAERCRGNVATSIAKLEEALAFFEGPDHPVDEVEARAELAASHLAAGDVDRALRMTQHFLSAPQSAFMAGTFPQKYHWVAAQVYRATGQHELARDQLAAAIQVIEDRMQQCRSAESRAAFERFPVNEAIFTAVEALGSPTD